MTPLDVKKEIIDVLSNAGRDDLAIQLKDFFIGEKASIHTTWTGDLLRVLDYPARCNTCGKWIPDHDEKVVWIKNSGAWHPGKCWNTAVAEANE